MGVGRGCTQVCVHGNDMQALGRVCEGESTRGENVAKSFFFFEGKIPPPVLWMMGRGMGREWKALIRKTTKAFA